MLNKNKHLYFIGIGGIGMSGMAEFLLNQNFTISGSDIQNSERVRHLKKLGCSIYLEHSKDNIKKYDLVVYSSAINKSNPEIIAAQLMHIPIIKRAELLGQLIKLKTTSIGVSGTHGKTTSSSMLGNILIENKMEPSLIIGGIVNKLNNNNISGNGSIIVVEADEFDKSFLSLQPTHAIINNLDLEHLDSYKNIDDLKNNFIHFANSISFYGTVALCLDSPNLASILNKIKRKIITFSLTNKNANIYTKNIINDKNRTSFDVIINNKSSYRIKLNVPGEHNIYNALGTIALASELKIDKAIIQKGLEAYQGVKRRFDIRYYIKNKNILLIDDYAHHPVEINKTLNSIKAGWPNRRIIAIFQPHLYSRTQNFYLDFAESLRISDLIIITDIYGAREEPIKGVSSKLIYNELIRFNNKKYKLINNIDNVPNYIKSNINNDDIVITMGAGNIHTIIEKIHNVIK